MSVQNFFSMSKTWQWQAILKLLRFKKTMLLPEAVALLPDISLTAWGGRGRNIEASVLAIVWAQ